jgi:hypothetical protein
MVLLKSIKSGFYVAESSKTYSIASFILTLLVFSSEAYLTLRGGISTSTIIIIA